jgi:hypothetical protein
MSNVYVVSSATYVPGVPDPQVTIQGSVNGTPVTVSLWLSVLTAANAQGGLTAVKNVVAPIMLAAVPVAPVAPVSLPTGTFTQ